MVFGGIGRRYLRILKFLDAFNLGFEVFRSGNGWFEVRKVVEFAKWNFLGVYLGLESLTVVSFCFFFSLPLPSSCSVLSFCFRLVLVDFALSWVCLDVVDLSNLKGKANDYSSTQWVSMKQPGQHHFFLKR
jgi:hypothetical protein